MNLKSDLPQISETELLLALMQAPTSVCLLDGPDFRLRFYNDGFSLMLGLCPALGAPLFSFAPESEKSPQLALLRRVLGEGCTIAKANVAITLGSRPAGQKTFYCDFRCSPWVGDGGQVRGVFVVCVDVTEKVQALAQVATQDKRLSAMANALPHAVFVTEGGGAMRYVNQRFIEKTGVDAASFSREVWQRLIHPEDQPSIDAQWTACCSSHKSFDGYARLRASQSVDYRWHRLLAKSYAEAHENDIVWVGSWTDVHDRIEAEHAHRTARKRFVAALSHDVRSPLSAIRLSIENIQRKPESKPFKPKFDRMIRTLDQANQMLENLLDVDAIDAKNPLPVHLRPTSLQDALGLSIENHKATWGERFVAQVPTGVVGVWHGPTLQRAVDNLVGNAFKYGDEKREVSLQVDQDESTCIIRVHNYGPPITPADQRLIFEPHTRVQGQTQKGWGIGLSMVLSTVEAHKGKISVVSDKERGTTFELRLPKNLDRHVSGGTR